MSCSLVAHQSKRVQSILGLHVSQSMTCLQPVHRCRSPHLRRLGIRQYRQLPPQSRKYGGRRALQPFHQLQNLEMHGRREVHRARRGVGTLRRNNRLCKTSPRYALHLARLHSMQSLTRRIASCRQLRQLSRALRPSRSMKMCARPWLNNAECLQMASSESRD